MHTWQMQEAKSRLSEVVKDAEREGPQELDVDAVVMAVGWPGNVDGLGHRRHRAALPPA